MKIPKIIHQTWKDNKPPIELKQFVQSWLKYHPDWEYKLWTDDQNRSFIKRNYSWFLDIYDSYPYNIQRVDAIRYFILLDYGGVYVDLDFECLKSIEPLLRNKDCVMGLEPSLHCDLHKVDKIISNAFMASIPNHSFLQGIIADLISYNAILDPNSKKAQDNYILSTTGPFMINRVFDHISDTGYLDLLPSKYLFPLNIFELERLIDYEIPEYLHEKIADAYAIHYHMGTWWKSSVPMK